MLKKHADRVVLITTFILLVLGLVMLVSASSESGKIKFNDTYYYIKHQLIYGFGPGLLGFLAGLFISYKNFKRLAFIFLLLNLAALTLVFVPFTGANFGAADRWISVAGVTLQPSELLKFTFIVYLAAWLTSRTKNRKSDVAESFLPFLILSGIIAFLLIIQPSTSTVIILMTAALIVYFINGARISFIAGVILVGILGLGLVISLTPYRLQRITTFINPGVDLEGTRYHLNQSLITIGSGSVFGVGYGNSVSKIKYLPEPIGDSIFAVIAEELGFLGAIFFIGLFFILVMAGFLGSRNVRNQFGRLTVIGFSSVLAVQIFVHIAAISGMIPLTGVPLPFISYGGTALATFMTMSGLTVNILRNG
jgi:cell division protein FtsW